MCQVSNEIVKTLGVKKPHRAPCPGSKAKNNC